jgi:hypothetical protein
MTTKATSSSTSALLSKNPGKTRQKQPPAKVPVEHPVISGFTPAIMTKSVCPCDGGCPGCSSDQAGLESRIHSLRGEGQPLSKADREFFEPRFGQDFSDVKLHTDAGAAKAAQSLDAAAFTTGNHIVFGDGRYTPGTPAGQQLLAHELTHVVQQGGGSQSLSSDASLSSTPVIQRNCPGSSYRSGCRYSGGGSEAYVGANMPAIIARYNSAGDTRRADGAEVFLMLTQQEGFISAINTWDNQIFTWGVGFGGSIMVNKIWRKLHPAAKAAITAGAGRYFRPGGVTLTNDIRRDYSALRTIVRVSEHPVFAKYVLDAQLQVFLEETMGIPAASPASGRFPTRDTRVLAMAAHLSHWTPHFFEIPADLNQAFADAGGTATHSPPAEVFAAAVIRIHLEKMIRTGDFGVNVPRRHRSYNLNQNPARRTRRQLGYYPLRRYNINYEHYFVRLTNPPAAQSIVPALGNPTRSYFVPQYIGSIPPGHLLIPSMGYRHHYYDFGPRPSGSP